MPMPDPNKNFRYDNVGKFINEEVLSFFESKGIRIEMSTPYMPGKSDCTILHMTRSILETYKLNATNGVEAMATTTYLTNHAPMTNESFRWTHAI
jgi:hypothetical protein